MTNIRLTCPYCGKKFDGEKYDLRDKHIFGCSCKKKFRYYVYVEYDTQADCELNGEEHDWVLTQANAGTMDGVPYDWHDCSKCDQGTHKLQEESNEKI